MFNKDFYPTPQIVIERMLFGTEYQGKIILEPSAGKGDIVDYLKENGAKEVIACENNHDLAKIVSGKCRLMHNNFFDTESHEISHIDMIVMNPPFSNEEAHILHAWKIAPGGCIIISLCNSSILTKYEYRLTEKQKEIQTLIEQYGNSDDFYDCFSDAERKTGVDISCIWLYKPKAEENEFDGYFDLEEEEESKVAALVKPHYIRDIVWRYVDAVKMFDSVIESSNKLNSLTDPISKYGIKFGAFKTGESNYSNNEITRDAYKKELQKQCWQKVFSEMNMEKYITSGVKETINKFVEQQTHVPFTMKNVYNMIDIIVGTHGSRMNQVLVEAFEQICSFSWSDNCTGGRGWKTNSDYMINKKFIVPYICEYDFYGSKRGHVALCYRSVDKLNDIIKALCHLTGINYDDTAHLSEFVRTIPMEWGQWYSWGFFEIRGYKKGTMHFKFQDEKVWEQFNRKVAEIKGWRLPSSTNKSNSKKEKSEVYNYN